MTIRVSGGLPEKRMGFALDDRRANVADGLFIPSDRGRVFDGDRRVTRDATSTGSEAIF